MSRNWFSFMSVRSNALNRSGKAPRALKVESLEGRSLLTTLSVVSDSGCAAEGDAVYCQIQEAVDAAYEGDVIHVADGTYDPVRIRTDHLTLRAADGAHPIINAGGAFTGIRLSGDGITVQGLTVENAQQGFTVTGDANTLTENEAQNVGTGFSLVSSDSNTLVNNRARNTVASGFDLTHSSSNTLQGNTAQDIGWHGFSLNENSNANTLMDNHVQVSRESGFYVHRSDSNMLQENTAQSSTAAGFMLLESSNDNTLYRNTAIDSGQSGFLLWSGGDSNVVRENTAEGNQHSGIAVLSSNNLIENNVAHDNHWGISVLDNKWVSPSTKFEDGVETPLPWGIGIVNGWATSSTGAHSNIVQNNRAEDNLHHGFLLAETDSNTYRDNVAKYNGADGFAIVDEVFGEHFGASKSNTFQGNVAIQNDGFGFSIPTWDDVVASQREDNRCVENQDGAASYDAAICSLPTAGDANGDGQFNQYDIVQVLQADRYLSEVPAVWSDGDWDRDGWFDQDDVVAALQTGGYLS